MEIECLTNLSPELSKSILALFVSIIFDYISEDKNLNEPELIKWGTTFLQRMGKILNLTEVEVSSIIKPVSQSLELKQLGMNFDDLKLEKRIHVNYIQEHLRPMQDSINDFFKQAIGTDDNESDFTNEFAQSETHNPPDQQDLLYDDPEDQDFLQYITDNKHLSQYVQDNQHVLQHSQDENPPQNLPQNLSQDISDNEDLFQDDLEVDDQEKEEEECFKRNFIENYRPDDKSSVDSNSLPEVLNTFDPLLPKEPTDSDTINQEHFNFNPDLNFNNDSVNSDFDLKTVDVNNTDLNRADLNNIDLNSNTDDINPNPEPVDMNINVALSNLSSSSGTELDTDELEQEADDLLRDLEKSLVHKSGPSNGNISLPTTLIII